jgi:hypothetical protein
MFSVIPTPTFAKPADFGTLQTHRAFVDSCYRELTIHVLESFTPNRTSPLVVVPDMTEDSSGTIAAEISSVLSDRGLLIRDDTAAYSGQGNWTLRYDLAPVVLTLSEPQRRKFLGKIWVRRTLKASIAIHVTDDAHVESIWSGTSDSTYFDWVPKSALKTLENHELSPQPPTTGWEKAKLPIIVGAGSIIVGAIMLALN